MTVSLEFLAAQLQRVIDKLGEHDALFGVLSAKIERTNVGLRHVEENIRHVEENIRHVEEKLDAVLAEHDRDQEHRGVQLRSVDHRLTEIERRLDRLEASP